MMPIVWLPHARSSPPDRHAPALSSRALTATMTVEADMSAAPTAGDSTTPAHASTPAASGMAITL